MTILDDAREGMNTAIRPQDDLFGHVNGTWLETAEIPSDRASWGPFVTLADEAEEHVRVIIEEMAAGKVASEEASKIGDLFASFMGE
ncbi:MAG TPA: peptidase M13, partial [Marmoricola sp.]|nr:peptidase M13 [Marmoricola sp.]